MSIPIHPVGGGVGARVIAGPARDDVPDRAEEVGEQDPQPRTGDLDSLRKLSEKVVLGGRTAEFSYDTKLDVIVVKIHSSSTEPREIVRQIPPEAYLKFQARYRELLGLLLDEQA